MLSALLSLSLLAQNAWQPVGHKQIPIWPGTPPDLVAASGPEKVVRADNLVGGKPWIAIDNVTRPTMTIYPARGRNTGAAMVVFPGGGYQILAIDLEGTEICEWLAAHGITGILLKYRVPNSGPHWDPKVDKQVTPKVLTALEDAQRTMGLVRLHAAEWHINLHKIGVVGFSAGGHLAAAISNAFTRLYSPVDAADRLSCRPDFAACIYPGHMWESSRGFRLNPAIKVTRSTSPTFLVMAEDDHVDGVEQALTYYIALKSANVPVEMHLFAHGGHAFGLRRTTFPITRWPDLMMSWLKTIGMIAG
ncbi:MAG TPA: alpha/beta hydrolase [Fimbriimonadaceae bacterium]